MFAALSLAAEAAAISGSSLAVLGTVMGGVFAVILGLIELSKKLVSRSSGNGNGNGNSKKSSANSSPDLCAPCRGEVLGMHSDLRTFIATQQVQNENQMRAIRDNTNAVTASTTAIEEMTTILRTYMAKEEGRREAYRERPTGEFRVGPGGST